VVVLLGFAFWVARAEHPLLPPRVVLDRNRSAAYLSMIFASLCLFATFLFLTYYMLGTDAGYIAGVPGPHRRWIGLGKVVAPSISTGTFGVAPQGAGVAAATVTVGQQLGASIGTSLLNTIFAGAVASYLVTHASAAGSTAVATRARTSGARAVSAT
jgi:hypothetical protein